MANKKIITNWLWGSLMAAYAVFVVVIPVIKGQFALTELLTRLVFALAAFNVVFDFGYTKNMGLLVPSWYEEGKRKSDIKMTEEIIQEYFEKDTIFLVDRREQHTQYIMRQLGLSPDQYQSVLTHMIRIKCMNYDTVERRKEKIANYITKKPFLIDQKDVPNRFYHQVRYYVDFASIMYCDIGDDIIHVFGQHIIDEMGAELAQIKRIVVPENGNFLLAYKLSIFLQKGLVRITTKPILKHDRYYEGYIVESKFEKAILVNDVLVEGTQIVRAIDHLKGKLDIRQMFFLLERLDYKTTHDEKLFRTGKKYSAILEIDDDGIETVISNPV